MGGGHFLVIVYILPIHLRTKENRIQFASTKIPKRHWDYPLLHDQATRLRQTNGFCLTVPYPNDFIKVDNGDPWSKVKDTVTCHVRH